MAGNCIIKVDDQYILGLTGVISQCHQEGSSQYANKYLTGKTCCKTCDVSLKNLMCLSDILYYISLYEVDSDNCKNIHTVKSAAMKICEFSEADILEGLFVNAILLEEGTPILLENGVEYLEIE